MVSFLVGTLTGVAGGLFGGGQLLADYTHRLAEHEQELAKLRADMISVDGRLNTERDARYELARLLDRRFYELDQSRAQGRRDLERTDSLLTSRVDVLEARQQFLLDRTGISSRLPPTRQRGIPQ